MDMTVKKDQTPRSCVGCYSRGSIKLYFKSLPVSKHRERHHHWSEAGDGRIICFGKCVSTPTPQRGQFLSHVSPVQAKQRLTEAGKWESDNGNKPRCSWLLPQPRHTRRFSVRGPSSSPGHFHDLFKSQVYGICQFIGRVLRSLTTLKSNL